MSLQGQGPAAISTYLTGTLLPSLTTLNVSAIYDHEDLPKTGFPAATVGWSEKPAKVADNARNFHNFIFTIRVYIDRTAKNFGSGKAETILKAVGAEILQKLDANPTLGGTCIVSDPATFKMAYVDQGSNNIRLVEVTLTCMDVNTWR